MEAPFRIGTEHLLLGLIREGSGLAARVLVHLGAELDSARSEVHGFHEGNPSSREVEAQRPGVEPHLLETVSGHLLRLIALRADLSPIQMLETGLLDRSDPLRLAAAIEAYLQPDPADLQRLQAATTPPDRLAQLAQLLEREYERLANGTRTASQP